MSNTKTNLMASIDETEGKCAWAAGELGDSVEHARPVSAEHENAVDEALGLQMISIRLPRSLIDDLKYFAKQEGLGYQPLMRRVLLRFASYEYKRMAMEQLVKGVAKEPVVVECEGDEAPLKVASR